MRGQMYAVGSGILAALASLCGKYAMASSEAQDLCEASLLLLYNEENITRQNQVDVVCGQVRVIYSTLT